MLYIRKIAKCLLIVTLGGCASIVSKSDYPLTVNSSIQEASVIITDKDGVQRFSGKAPVTTILPASDGYFTRARYEIKVTKPGYSESTTNLKASIDPWYWGNLVIGGIIGFFIVDPLTGSMFELEPQVVNAMLSPAQSPAALQKTDSKSASIVTSVINPSDLTKKLEEIKNLKDKGLISQSDFDSLKAKILNNMQ